MLSAIRNARNARNGGASQSIAVKKLDRIVFNTKSRTGAHRSWLTFQIWSGVHFKIQ